MPKRNKCSHGFNLYGCPLCCKGEPPVRFSELVLLLHGWRQIIREKRSEAINAKRMELNEAIAEKATIEADTMEVCMKMLENRMQQKRRNSRTGDQKTMNTPDFIEQPKAPTPVACSDLLEGWSVQRRSYGVGTCGGGSGDVLCYGKWGIIGGTCSYRILFPSGWIENRPKFKTELEAMLWVMAKGKRKPSNDKLSESARENQKP